MIVLLLVYSNFQCSDTRQVPLPTQAYDSIERVVLGKHTLHAVGQSYFPHWG